MGLERYFSNKVHYIWVGDNPIPDKFIDNYKNTKALNPTYEFKIWKDPEIQDYIPKKYLDQYISGTIYEKLQLARYNIANQSGGLITDFDISWNWDFDEMYSWFAYPVSSIFPYRNAMRFYDRGKSTTFVDDFIIISTPGVLGDFLQYCEDNSEPYHPRNLSLWVLTQPNVKFIPHKLIDDGIMAIHDNKATYETL